MEQTFIIIKPDGMNHSSDIISIFLKNGLKILDYKYEKLDEEILSKHYSHIKDKPFFPNVVSYMTSSTVLLMVLEGNDAIKKVRELVGCTDSRLASKGTIRNLYGTDKTYNAIHASDSIENAKIEIKRFFKKDIKILKLLK